MTTSLPEDSPVGFGFRPTDEEIMNHYLRLKMIGKDSEVDNAIAEVDDVCTFDPWELPPKSKIKSNDQIWWFFTRRDPERKTTKRKTKTGITTKRKTKTGSWGLTGEERQITGRDGRVLGKKKYVVFSTGPNRGRRSNWVIHEYHPLPLNVLPKQRHYVICRLENKTDEKAGLTSCDEGEPSCNITSDVEIAPSAISEASQSRQSPLRDFIDKEISLPSRVGFSRDHNGMQALYGAGEPVESPEETMNRLSADPDADPYTKFYWESGYNPFNDRIPQASSWRRRNEDGLVRSDTNTEGVNEQSRQAKRGLGLSDSPVGSKKTQILQMGGTSSEELQGDIPRERHPRIQLQDRVSSTAEFANMVEFQALDITREPPRMRVQLQGGSVSSTDLSGHMVHTEAATNDSISRLDCCIIAVVFCIIAVIVAFDL